MVSDAIGSGSQANETIEPTLQRQIEEWRDLLGQCARRPSRQHVHALRSLTLRLRAALEFHVAALPPEPAEMRAFRRWNKEGRKLRRTLEPIRDADVFLARLRSLHDILRVSIAQEDSLNSRSQREIFKLESRLRHRRQREIDKLMVTLAARYKRLKQLSEEMEAALCHPSPSTVRATAQAAMEIFERLNVNASSLEAATLHSFRKRLKHALYLSEISAKSDPVAGRQAAAFRKMHRAVGKWHDWQSLAEEASRILSRRTKRDGLAPLLETLTEEALQKALALCQRSTAQLLNGSGVDLPPSRKPVRNANREVQGSTEASRTLHG
jgi:hypothetical protein